MTEGFKGRQSWRGSSGGRCRFISRDFFRVIGRDGVILGKRGRSAVFLPQVAPEQGWDVPTMLMHLSLKAGLGPDDWKSGASFKTFRAQVFKQYERKGK